MKTTQYNDGYLLYRSSKTGKRDFRIPAPEIFEKEISKIMKFRTQWMFPNPKTNKPYFDLRSPILTACQRLGLPRVTFHMIRHLTADLMAQTSGKEMAVKEFLGWSSIEMVRRYSHLENWANQYIPALEQRITNALCGSEQMGSEAA